MYTWSVACRRGRSEPARRGGAFRAVDFPAAPNPAITDTSTDLTITGPPGARSDLSDSETTDAISKADSGPSPSTKPMYPVGSVIDILSLVNPKAVFALDQAKRLFFAELVTADDAAALAKFAEAHLGPPGEVDF